MSQPSSTARWVRTALFTAMATVATMVITVPSPTGGYLNAGDCIVILGAYCLGPVYGAIAGGIGSAMADVLLGYTAYAPATLIIKGLMALVAGLLMKLLGTKLPGRLGCGLAAELVMMGGYWLYDAWLLGSLLGAAPSLVSNSVQALFGLLASTGLALALATVPAVRREFAHR